MGNEFIWLLADTSDSVFKGLNETSGSIFFNFWRDSPQWARASSFMRFPDHTQLRTTFGRSPLDD